MILITLISVVIASLASVKIHYPQTSIVIHYHRKISQITHVSYRCEFLPEKLRYKLRSSSLDETKVLVNSSYIKQVTATNTSPIKQLIKSTTIFLTKPTRFNTKLRFIKSPHHTQKSRSKSSCPIKFTKSILTKLPSSKPRTKITITNNKTRETQKSSSPVQNLTCNYSPIKSRYFCSSSRNINIWTIAIYLKKINYTTLKDSTPVSSRRLQINSTKITGTSSSTILISFSKELS